MLCEHGAHTNAHRAGSCTLCVKATGECDFGGCTRRAALKLIQTDESGQVRETRPACRRCTPLARSLGYRAA